MEMTYHLTLLLLLVIQIRDLTTGHHTIITFNSKLLTFCFIRIRCPPGISTSCLTSGPHLLPSTMTNPHSLMLQICIRPLILLPLVTSPGNLLVYSMMACSLWKGFHHGCKQSTMCGSEIHMLSFITSCQTQISNLILITCHFKKKLLMESISSKTSCLETGPGIKL
jgi:hypothetical protein